MKLKANQKERLLELIAEGLETPEINDRAAEFNPPFDVSKQQVDYYRRTRFDQLAELKKKHENRALNEGLSRIAVRVGKLVRLAEKMEEDLLDNGKMWLKKPKSVNGELVAIQEFNKSEVDAYMSVLDDIAKELGQRVTNVNTVMHLIDWNKITRDQLERLAGGTNPLLIIQEQSHT